MKRYLIPIIVLGAVTAMAQVPSGKFSYPFTSTPLWDATGTFTRSFVSNGDENYQTVDVTQTAMGKIGGSFSDTINASGVGVIVVSSSLTGKISVKHGVVGATLQMKSGTMTGAATGTAKGVAKLTFNASTRTIDNDYKLTLCERRGCKTFSGSVPFLLPAGVTGDWTLNTTIVNNVDKLSGTGTLTLSTGRVFTYQIIGTYNTKSGVSKLKLVGARGTDAAGSSLSLTTQGTNMTLITLKGKVLGQTPTVLP